MALASAAAKAAVGARRDETSAAGEQKALHAAWALALGSALCLGGCLVSALVPPAGCALMAAGGWVLASRVRHGRVLATLSCLAPLATMCVLSWTDMGSYALPPTACALALSLGLAGRLGVTAGVLVVLGTAALMVGCDQLVLAAAGSSVVGYVGDVLDALSAQLSTAGAPDMAANLAVSMAYDQAIDAMRSLWPLLYVAQGALAALLGMAGLALARRLPASRARASFLGFAVPAWGIVALVASACLLAASRLDVPAAAVLYSAGMCALIFMRALYFLQGLAVGTCLMCARRMGPLPRVLVLVAMLLLESAFFAVSVFGALDTFARFRLGLDLGDQEERASLPQPPEPPCTGRPSGEDQ